MSEALGSGACPAHICGSRVAALRVIEALREQRAKRLHDRLIHHLHMAAGKIADLELPADQIAPAVMDSRIERDGQFRAKKNGIALIGFRPEPPDIQRIDILIAKRRLGILARATRLAAPSREELQPQRAKAAPGDVPAARKEIIALLRFRERLPFLIMPSQPPGGGDIARRRRQVGVEKRKKGRLLALACQFAGDTIGDEPAKGMAAEI